jgi:hypothetical protein
VGNHQEKRGKNKVIQFFVLTVFPHPSLSHHLLTLFRVDAYGIQEVVGQRWVRKHSKNKVLNYFVLTSLFLIVSHSFPNKTPWVCAFGTLVREEWETIGKESCL